MSKKKIHKNCLMCGKETKRTTTSFCSFACRGKYRTLHKIKQGGPVKTKNFPRPCEYCGKEFQGKTEKQKYCSKHCMGMVRKKEWIEFCKNRTGPRDLTLEQRKNMSIAASQRNAKTVFTKGIGGIRPDIGHHVRSSWEANFARYLKYKNISYEYEKDRFTLITEKKVITYLPDFKIKDKEYYEVKGWWDEKSLLKKDLMEKQFPEIIIHYIDEPIYLEIERTFGNDINGWEYPAERRRATERVE
jgi:hypothetical protein